MEICVAQALFANIFPQMVAAIVLEKVTFSRMRSNSETLKQRTVDGETPLLAAVDGSHLEVVKFLVEAGASKDQDTTDNDATSLLRTAEDGDFDIVRFLVESGANKN